MWGQRPGEGVGLRNREGSRKKMEEGVRNVAEATVAQ